MKKLIIFDILLLLFLQDNFRKTDANLLQTKNLIPDLIVEINRLTKIEAGKKGSFNYQRLISKILLNIFKGSFRNMESEMIAHEGYKRIDAIYTNVATDGFF